MKYRRLIAILLALSLMVMACACGASTSSVAASASEATEVSEADTAEAPEAEAVAEPSDVDSAEEPDSAAEEIIEEPAFTIDYPLEEGGSFSMVACRNNVTAEAFGDGGYEQTPVYQAISEATGITLDFQLIAEQTYNEKLNLMMASGDLPDIIGGNLGTYASNPLAAIEDDILMDIAPYLEENAPDYVTFLAKFPEVKVNAFNVDGSTSGFRSSGYPYKSKGLNVRRDWLEQVGMDTPTTFEELTETLKAFKTELGATMPLLVTSDLGSGLEQYFQFEYSGFRSLGFQFTAPDSGEVVCNFASEPFIEYITYMHDLYNQGLLTNDFLNTGRDYGNFESSYLGGASGIWEDGANLYSPAFLSRGEEGYDPEPFILENEERTHVSDVSGYDFIAGANFITAKCSDPETVCKFFNYCYTEAGQLLYNFGVEGVSYEYNEDGEIVYTEIMTDNPDGWAINLCRAFYTGMWLCGEGMYRAVELQNDEVAMAAIELWTNNAGDKSMSIPDDVVLNVAENEEYLTYAGDVLTTLTENASKAVVGDITIDEYREVLDQLQDGGLATVTELWQGAYDRYLSGDVEEED